MKNGFLTQFYIKITVFWQKNIFLKHQYFSKMSLFDIFMKSPNYKRTDFFIAMGPKEMDSSLNLQPKSLGFRNNFFFKNIFWKIGKTMTVLLKKVKNWGIKPWKSPNSEKKVDFSEPWDKKKWIPYSICNKNHYVLGEKNSKLFKKSLFVFCPFGGCLILPALWKCPYSEKTKFFRTIGPKKNGFPTQFTIKITMF